MPRFIDMTDAQKGRVWERHVQGNPAALASWIEQLRRDYREAGPGERGAIVRQGERLQSLHVAAVGRRHP